MVHVFLGLIFFLFVQTHYHSLPYQKSYSFSQWQWLLAWQLSEGTRMPLQILKAMPERNICPQGSKQNKITPSIIILILTKSSKKSTLQASSLGQAKQEGECPTKLARRLHLIAKIDQCEY